MFCVAPTLGRSANLQVPAKDRDVVVLKHCRINVQVLGAVYKEKGECRR